MSLVESINVVKYTWVDGKVVGTPFVMNIKAAIGIDDITVGEPLDWLVLPMGLEKKICNFFDNYLVSFFGQLFSLILRMYVHKDFHR